MVSIMSLWLPIVLSAVIVFLAAALMWMVAPHHKGEMKGVSNEEAARAALKGLAPGQYMIPWCPPERRNDPEMIKKQTDGPIAVLTVLRSGVTGMGKSMAQSVVYYLAVGFLAAYVASRTLAPGTHYLQVFRVVGTVTWLAYGWGAVSDAIWFGKPWSNTFKHMADSLVYGLLTAGTFGWLWPQM